MPAPQRGSVDLACGNFGKIQKWRWFLKMQENELLENPSFGDTIEALETLFAESDTGARDRRTGAEHDRNAH